MEECLYSQMSNISDINMIWLLFNNNKISQTHDIYNGITIPKRTISPKNLPSFAVKLISKSEQASCKSWKSIICWVLGCVI